MKDCASKSKRICPDLEEIAATEYDPNYKRIDQNCQILSTLFP